MLPATSATEPVQVTMVMELTRNAWVPLAAWFRRRGAAVVPVPPERAAELRANYAKHTGRLDSVVRAGFRCCTPTGCISRPVLAQESRRRLDLDTRSLYSAPLYRRVR